MGDDTMNRHDFVRSVRQSRRCAIGYLLVFLSVGLLRGTTARCDESPTSDQGYFFTIPGAKDCVFDSKRQRLYVTTLKQLIILDAKERKVVEEIDLLGNVRACDISPDLKYLAIAPFGGQFLYWIDLDTLDINQVKFKAGGSESGVFDLRVGFDNTVLFSMTYAGSGWIQLRVFDPASNSVREIQKVSMDSVISTSGDRRYAAVAEGNSSAGPLNVYDFQEKQLKKVARLDCFHYEIACAAKAKYFARPHVQGCDLYDSKGSKLGTLTGKPVIAAAFHPKGNSLYVMRDGESNIQEYDVQGNSLAKNYPLDNALKIQGTVNARIVAQVQPAGPNAAIVNLRRVASVHFKAFQSGRVRVSDDGENLLAVVPGGVYMFKTKQPADAPGEVKPKRRINVIESTPDSANDKGKGR